MWRKKTRKYPVGRLIKLLIVVIILISFPLFIISKFSPFIIKKIEVVRNNISCVDDNQLIYSSGLMGKNLLFPHFKNVEKNLKEKFICIRNINFSLFFSNEVKMKVDGRQPAASLFLLQSKEASVSSSLENIATPSAQQTQGIYSIDNEGVVFAKDAAVGNLPGIFLYEGAVFLGTKAVGNLENSLKILNGAKKLGLDIKISSIFDDILILFSYPRIVFKLDGKIDMQLASLQLILTEAKIDLKELEFIDLRFDKPLVRFAPKK